MRVLHEKSPGDKSPSGLIRDYISSKNKQDKQEYKNAARRLSNKRWDAEIKERKKSRKSKEERLKWQMERAKIRDQLRKDQQDAAAAKSTGGGKAISATDSDTKATEAAAGNAAGVGISLFKAAVGAAGNRMRKKAEAKKAGEEKAGEKAAETKAAMKQKLLPPGRSGPNEITDKTSRRQPGTSRPGAPNPNFSQAGQNIRNRARQFNPNIPRLPPASSPTSTTSSSRSPHPFSYTNPNAKNRIKKVNVRVLDSPKLLPPAKSTNEEYEYSCWREEFLYELGELRQKAKKRNDEDSVIDIMTGENKITLNPNITEATKILKEQAKIKILKYAASQYPKMNEEMNSASHMAKATPRITGHDKSSSDKNKLKQPGKYSAEFVRDEMRKMYQGNRNYWFDSNNTNGNLDDGEVSNVTQSPSNESYDGHRHHSSGETTNVSNSSSEASARRRRATSAVLNAMAALEPKAKKKKKKKKNEQ